MQPAAKPPVRPPELVREGKVRIVDEPRSGRKGTYEAINRSAPGATEPPAPQQKRKVQFKTLDQAERCYQRVAGRKEKASDAHKKGR